MFTFVIFPSYITISKVQVNICKMGRFFRIAVEAVKKVSHTKKLLRPMASEVYGLPSHRKHSVYGLLVGFIPSSKPIMGHREHSKFTIIINKTFGKLFSKFPLKYCPILGLSHCAYIHLYVFVGDIHRVFEVCVKMTYQ